MFAFANLEVLAAGDGGSGIDEVGGIEQLGAGLALIASGALKRAIGAGTDDVAVGKKAIVIHRKNLLGGALLNERVFLQFLCKILGDFAVLRRGAAPEVIEGQAEAFAQGGLDIVLLTAKFFYLRTGFERGQLGGRAVFVGGADEQDFVAGLTQKTGVYVGRQHGAYEVSKMLDAVDVGQRACDQMSLHSGPESVDERVRATGLPRNGKIQPPANMRPRRYDTRFNAQNLRG